MTTDSPPQAEGSPRPLRWPPPGLERLQGDLGRIAGRGALAGGLLVLPLLFVVAREQGFATLGPLADAWWVTIVLTSFGLAFAIDALVRTSRGLRRAAEAIGHGYDLKTILHVVADTDHDMGFLLQGVRHFVVMDVRERQAMVRVRVFAVACLALSGLWLMVALGFGLLAAARGLLSPTGLWTVTLLPAMAGYAFGAVGRLLHDSRVRRARRAYHTQPWSKDLASDEIERWRAERAAVGSMAELPSRPSPRLRPFLRQGAFLVAAVGVVVAAPVLTLLPTSVAGPVLSTIATPRFDQVRQRSARVEGFRKYRVPVDSTLSPQVAGQLLHDLSHVGVDEPVARGAREPSRRVSVPWLPETGDENPMGIAPFDWGDRLIEVVAEGTTGAQRAYLGQIAAHPSTADFSRRATAADIDVASARWESPFPEGTTLATMPMPRLGPLREGAQGHIAAAAYALVQGEPQRAERMISEVISVGFLLSDRAPTLIDNLIGYTLVDAGARAIEDLYAATGRTAELETLASLRVAAERAGRRVRVGLPQGTETWVRSLPDAVMDTSAVRGLRWEYFMGVTTLTPCLNLHRMVFGPDEAYAGFLEQAHDQLVLFPSEEGLFEIASAGWLGAIRADQPTFVGRVLSLAMNQGESACGEVIQRLETTRAIF